MDHYSQRDIPQSGSSSSSAMTIQSIKLYATHNKYTLFSYNFYCHLRRHISRDFAAVMRFVGQKDSFQITEHKQSGVVST